MFKNSPFGTWGVILGLLAFGAGLMHFWFGPFHTKSNTQTFEQTIVDKTIAIKDAFAAKLKGRESRQKPAPEPAVDIDKAVDNATIVFAFLSIVLAVLSFLKREDIRYTSTAVVLGSATLAFQFLLVAMGMLIVLLIVLFVAAQFFS